MSSTDRLTDETWMRERAMHASIAEAHAVLARLTPIPSPAQRERAEMLAELRARRGRRRACA